MQVQIITDNHIQGSAELSGQVQSKIDDILGRFDDWVTRVEVHLSDVNSHKSTEADKRCVLEARPAGLQPVSASHQADSLDQAVTACARKLARMLDDIDGRLGDARASRSAGRPRAEM
jgi:hypothetical protein